MEKKDYQKELIEIIRSNIAPQLMQEKLFNYHENDIAAVLEFLTENERKKLYRILETDTLSEVFEYLEEEASIYFGELDMKKKTEIISNMDADKAVAILRQLDKKEREELIDLIDNKSKRDIAMIASFDEEEIGSRMTTNYIKITVGMSVQEAMHALVEQAAENDNISTLYVVDDNRNYFGAIDLKDLIIARRTTKLESIIINSYPYVYGREQITDCIERLKEYSENSIPVLDNENKLLGVITSQNIVTLVEDELDEDYARLAGLTAEEDINEPIKESIKKRMPWLLVLLALGMVVSSVIGLFENVVAEITIAVCFQSLVLDMAGNAGTQSLAVTVRVLMDENLTGKQKIQLVLKEIRVGLSNGILLGILAFLFIGAYICLFRSYSVTIAFCISACIGLALILSMMLSSLSGTVIPLFFNKVGVDPAVASGPLITTLNDLVAIVSYYGLVWIFLIRILHLTGTMGM